MSKETKTKTSVGKLIAAIVIAVLFIVLVSPGISAFLPGNTASGWNEFRETYFAGTTGADISIKSVAAAVIAIVAAAALAYIVSFIFDRIKSSRNSAKAFVFLAGPVIKLVIWIAGIAVALSCFGISLTAILAGVGIAGVVLGLGAENIISDILAGFRMVVDGSINIGDIVAIDDFRGEVVSVGLCTVSLRDPGGSIRTINNSEITSITNLSDSVSVLAVEVFVAYEDELVVAEQSVADGIEAAMKAHPELFKSTPVYRGVETLGEETISLLVTANVAEENIYDAKRILQREIHIAGEKLNLRVPTTLAD